MRKLYINVENDRDRGWIIELPRFYAEGLEYEIESYQDTREDAIEEANRIKKNTGLPVEINEEKENDTN